MHGSPNVCQCIPVCIHKGGECPSQRWVSELPSISLRLHNSIPQRHVQIGKPCSKEKHLCGAFSCIPQTFLLLHLLSQEPKLPLVQSWSLFLPSPSNLKHLSQEIHQLRQGWYYKIQHWFYHLLVWMAGQFWSASRTISFAHANWINMKF